MSSSKAGVRQTADQERFSQILATAQRAIREHHRRTGKKRAPLLLGPTVTASGGKVRVHVPSDAPAWEKVLVLGSDQANIAHCEADLPKGDFATLFATVKVTFRQVQDHQSDRRTTRGSYDLSDDFCF